MLLALGGDRIQALLDVRLIGQRQHRDVVVLLMDVRAGADRFDPALESTVVPGERCVLDQQIVGAVVRSEINAAESGIHTRLETAPVAASAEHTISALSEYLHIVRVQLNAANCDVLETGARRARPIVQELVARLSLLIEPTLERQILALARVHLILEHRRAGHRHGEHAQTYAQKLTNERDTKLASDITTTTRRAKTLL